MRGRRVRRRENAVSPALPAATPLTRCPCGHPRRAFGNAPGLGYGTPRAAFGRRRPSPSAAPGQDHRRDTMLTALRRLARTWVAKALFGLLILSFAVWGIEDTVRNFGRDDAIARVGGAPIEMAEADAALRRETQRLTRVLGPQFEVTEPIRLALARQALDSLVMDRVLRQETERMNLAVPDEAVREAVFTLEGFRGLDGRFSRPVFDNFLRNNGMTEAQFLALIRADLARRQMTEAVRAGAAVPDALARALFRWQREERAATLVTLATAEAPDPEAPTTVQLERFLENNAERFSTPEYRVAAVATLTADRIMREIEVSDRDLAQAYETARARFELPERRALEQVLVQDEAAAKRLAEAWGAGAAFSEIAAQAEAAGGTAVELGTLARTELPVAELADAAFALPPGGVSAPVRTGFGWHVLKLVRIEPPQAKTLAEVRDLLRDEIAGERAADLAFERANRVEDALAGGATLKEAAERFNLGYAEIRTDPNGLGPDGEPVALPVIEASREPLLKQVFDTPQGTAPRLKETEAGFVAVDVIEVIPPRVRPFAAIEPALRAAWTTEQKRRAQEERAAALLAAVQTGGKTLAEAASEAGLPAREVGGLRRDPGPGEAAAIPRELLAPLFELPPKGATMVRTREGYAVAQVTEITRPDPAPEAEAIAQLRREAARAMATDLEVQFLSALRERADVRVNPRLVEQLARP